MTLEVRIDRGAARARLEQAVAIARTDIPLPPTWIERIIEVGRSERRVDVAVLGCALLAKSCDSRINPLIVKRGVSERGYNMRGLAEGVLAPARHKYGIDLGSTSSANPVNSSTWLKYRTLEDVVTRNPDSYARLLAILREVDLLDEEEALYALAAWVRLRMAITEAKRSLRISNTEADLASLLDASRTFVLENPEKGARGQALVAAAFDLVWNDVKTGKVTDPSRHWPGDVHAFYQSQSTPHMAAEVKQRIVVQGEVRDFIGSCASRGIRNIFYIALHGRQEDMSDIDPAEVATRNGCVFTWLNGVDHVLLTAFAWSSGTVAESIQRFVRGMLDRLEDVELPSATQARWAELTASSAGRST